MAKSSDVCQVKGCMRRASHQPTLRVWPVGTPTSLTTRCLNMRLRVHKGICKRHAEVIKPDDVLNELVLHEVNEAMRVRYNAVPDMTTAQVLVRRIGS